MPDDDRDLNWTWLAAGAAVVLLLASRRARFWLVTAVRLRLRDWRHR